MKKMSFYNVYIKKKEQHSNYWLERDDNGRPRAAVNGESGTLYRYVSESFYRQNC